MLFLAWILSALEICMNSFHSIFKDSGRHVQTMYRSLLIRTPPFLPNASLWSSFSCDPVNRKLTLFSTAKSQHLSSDQWIVWPSCPPFCTFKSYLERQYALPWEELGVQNAKQSRRTHHLLNFVSTHRRSPLISLRMQERGSTRFYQVLRSFLHLSLA